MVRVKQKMKRSDTIRSYENAKTVAEVRHFCTEK